MKKKKSYSIFEKSVHGMSPVVAIALFLVVTVISAAGFQSWYVQYSSEVFTEVETSKGPSLSVLSNDHDIFYIRNNRDTNINITTFKVNGYDCGNAGFYSPGVIEMDLNCDYALDTENSELVIVTTEGIISHDFYVEEPFTCEVGNVEGFAGGDGYTSSMKICDCSMLQLVNSKDYGFGFGLYELTNDIDCSMTSEWNSGEGFDPLYITNGSLFFFTLNGNGHAIRNLYIDRPTEDNIGLFNSSLSVMDMENLALLDINITGQNYVGSLIGLGEGFQKNNFKITGNVYGNNYVGGFIGRESATGDFRFSYINVEVEGNSNVGGVYGGTGAGGSPGVLRSFSLSDVTGSSNTGNLVGERLGSFICSDFFFYNISSSLYHFGSLSSDTCSSSSVNEVNNIEDFYGNTNEPMIYWGGEDWSFADDRLPKLRDQN